MSDRKTDNKQEAQKVTYVGLVVNLLFIGLKLAGGLWGHSQALIADAVHSLSDVFTDVVVLIGLKLGSKAPDQKHHFGHGRLETLASAIVGLVLIIAAVGIACKAAMAIYYQEIYQPTWLALIVAGLSIVAKEALFRYTVFVARRINSPVLKANAWHHRSDALSSVAVLLGVAAALINPAWHILDAYAALVVSLLIVKVGLSVIWDSIREFTDTAPSPEILESILACARSVSGVISVHDLKVRTAAGQFQAELHVVVDGNLTVFEGHRIAKEVEFCLTEDIENLEGIIVHVDPFLSNQIRKE